MPETPHPAGGASSTAYTDVLTGGVTAMLTATGDPGW